MSVCLFKSVEFMPIVFLSCVHAQLHTFDVTPTQTKKLLCRRQTHKCVREKSIRFPQSELSEWRVFQLESKKKISMELKLPKYKDSQGLHTRTV